MTVQETDVIGLMDPNRFALKETLEQLIRFLDLNIIFEGAEHRVTTQRLKSRPYDTLNASPCPYRAILNRGVHWNPHHGSYLSIVGSDVYLLNDIVSFLAIDKNASYAHMHKLGLRVPKTVAIPQQDYSEIKMDPRVNTALVFDDFEMFDLAECGDTVGYPAYLKPQAGGGWYGVTRVDSYDALLEAYNRSGGTPMNLQRAVEYREFVRAIGVGPQVIPTHFNPKATKSHDRYFRSRERAIDYHFLSESERDEVKRLTLVINAFFNWDHNSCEIAIDPNHAMFLIDFANAYPDSSPVTLHYYFPELIKGLAKWLIFAAVTRRKKPYFAQNWAQFFQVRDEADREGLDYEARLDRYYRLALEHFSDEAFHAFCDAYLPDFDAQVYDFLGHDRFTAILEKEIQYYFKDPDVVPAMIEHYVGLHDFWLHCERGRLRALHKEKK